ncbi:MAG: hypothetical protein IBX61_01320 [Thermoleophilia bacterium]|nr:hypothetical protein [Thermoleophilia bacterium]
MTKPDNRLQPHKMIRNRILLNPSSVAIALGSAAFTLVLISTAMRVALRLFHQELVEIFGLTLVETIFRLFYVDVERNIPTAFSSLLLLFAALLLAVITVLERKQAGSPASKWGILSFGFLFMAFDEAWSFHERLSKHITWLIPAAALVFVLVLFFLRFWWRLPARTRLAFLISAVIYLGGVMGFELVGAYVAELYGQAGLRYGLTATVEESLEMAGVIVFIWALLSYMAGHHEEVTFRFESSHEDAAEDQTSS